MSVLVNYGCGTSAPVDWINFDASPRLRIERLPGIGSAMRASGNRLFPPNVRYGDIVKGLPVGRSTADAVFSSHALEHIHRSDMPAALANTLKIMKSGAPFRMVIPDIGWRAAQYQKAIMNGETDAADMFLRSCMLGEANRPVGIMGRARAMFGNSQHRWMYDYALMEKLLTDAGFTGIRPATFGDSELAAFQSVEHPDRFVDSGNQELAIEARKP